MNKAIIVEEKIIVSLQIEINMATAKKKDSPVKRTQKKSGFSPAQIKLFGSEVKAEFNKVAWPNKKHTIGSTIVITIFVTMVAVYLGAVDLLIGKLIGLVLK